MFQEAKQSDSPPCPQWELLLRHVVQPEALTGNQREQISGHIAECEHCADTYDALCEAEQSLWNEAAALAGLRKRELTFAHSAEEGLADLWARIEKDEVYQYRYQVRTVIFRGGTFAAAVAACIALTVAASWLFSPRTTPSIQVSPQGSAELITGNQRRALALGQPLTSEGRQELLLAGMHRVVMNQHTTATFTVNSQGAYQIQLAAGELYVEVVPGHPFTVTTSNARLTITGTQFDVKAAPGAGRTELTLLKGNIQFSGLARPQEAVSVTAGYASAVVGQAIPTEPAPVDALAATAWARDIALSNVVARLAPQAEGDLLELIQDSWQQPSWPDLDKLDYAAWRDAHRDWFTQQFPWIFKAQGALQKNHAVEADYLDLLMISGDIWQFRFDPNLPVTQPLARLEPIAIARLARFYQVDGPALAQSMGLSEPFPDGDRLGSQTRVGQYAEALRRWHKTLMTATTPAAASTGDALLITLRASAFLANTRTAVYLWMKAHPREAGQLLADDHYQLGSLAGLPSVESFSVALVSAQLSQQIKAMQDLDALTREQIMAPEAPQCVPGLSLDLASYVATLLPVSPAGSDPSQNLPRGKSP